MGAPVGPGHRAGAARPRPGGPAPARTAGGRRCALVGTLALAVAIAGCGSDSTAPARDETPPDVTITSPPDGASFVEGSAVTFEGSASEGDRALGGNALTWRSDRDGELGTGTTATAELSRGAHTVTLEATDDAGNRGSASVEVTVEENDPPSASIASPPDDTVVGQGAPVDFEGSATDPQSGELTGSDLAWSSDREGELGVGREITRDDLSAATHTIELVARDPQGLTDTASVSLTVEENEQPSATIGAPDDGAVFSEGEEITFEGSGSDPEDGELTGSSLAWTSDVDGRLGEGGTVSRDDLSPGSHTITLTAVDRWSAPASDAVEIEVDGDPDASIARPSDESVFDEREAVTLEGSATDPVEGDLGDASLEWTSDVDGVLGTGETLTTSSLAPGPHTVILTATDRDGNTGSASVRLLVESPGFDVRIRFGDGFSAGQRSTIEDAMGPWEAAVTGDLEPLFPSAQQDSVCATGRDGIDDLVIVVQLEDIDGDGGVLARAGPCLARLNASDEFTTVIAGVVFVDRADVGHAQLGEILTHEAGHVLGIGVSTISGPDIQWELHSEDLGTFDPSFTGPAAESAFDALGGTAHLSDGVPLENTGGQGTAGSHWREDNLTNELMTGFLDGGVPNPLSRLSVAALEDIGYEVDLSRADAYSLPMPQTAIWRAEADATLSRPASSDVNFGGAGATVLDSTIVAGANDGTWTSDPDDERFTGLLRLDPPSGLPPGVTVRDVILRLQVADVDAGTSRRDVQVVPITDAWDEASVTWDARPGFGSAVRTFPHDTAAGSLELSSDELTDLALGWADGSAPAHGVAFRTPDAASDPTFSVGFTSRHGPLPFLHPRIEVVAETGAGVRGALRAPEASRIPLGDDVRRGPLHGVGRDGRILRTVEIR